MYLTKALELQAGTQVFSCQAWGFSLFIDGIIMDENWGEQSTLGTTGKEIYRGTEADIWVH